MNPKWKELTVFGVLLIFAGLTFAVLTGIEYLVNSYFSDQYKITSISYSTAVMDKQTTITKIKTVSYDEHVGRVTNTNYTSRYYLSNNQNIIETDDEEGDSFSKETVLNYGGSDAHYTLTIKDGYGTTHKVYLKPGNYTFKVGDKHKLDWYLHHKGHEQKSDFKHATLDDLAGSGEVESNKDMKDLDLATDFN